MSQCFYCENDQPHPEALEAERFIAHKYGKRLPWLRAKREESK